MTMKEIALAMDAVVELKREKAVNVAVPAEVVETDAEAEADQESGGSSTEEAEGESPKSVSKFGRKKLAGGLYVHSQVLRVKKEEELLLKEDLDGVNNKERKNNKKKNDCSYQEQRHVNVVVFARPILPCSPLSRKTNNNGSTSLQTASH